jgi:hypothetical protein
MAGELAYRLYRDSDLPSGCCASERRTQSGAGKGRNLGINGTWTGLTDRAS